MSIWTAVVAGVVATLALDLWQRALLAWKGIPPSNWALVGRWFVEAFKGRLFPGKVAELPAQPNELTIGWIGHYAVGVIYGFVYLWTLAIIGSEPSLLNGLVFGALSTVVPWFFFMPAMGAGRLGEHTPDPKKACLLAFLAHCAFGIGLAVGAIISS